MLIDAAMATALSPYAGSLSPQYTRLLERLLCGQLAIVEALREFPRPFSDAASAYRECRRLRERANAGDRHRRASIRAEHQWRLMRALECCKAGLKSLLLGRFDEAFTRCSETWDWAAAGLEAAVRMRKGRAHRQRGLDAEFSQTVARAYESELPKAREQIAAERSKLDPATLQRLAEKRARRNLVVRFKLQKEAGRKQIMRALARANETSAED